MEWVSDLLIHFSLEFLWDTNIRSDFYVQNIIRSASDILYLY